MSEEVGVEMKVLQERLEDLQDDVRRVLESIDSGMVTMKWVSKYLGESLEESF